TRSDGGRKPIGRRTETDRKAYGNDSGCSCLSCTNQANRTIYSGCPHCTNQANATNVGGTAFLP
ncbi:MAG: hypothetical protein SPE71_04205, partial [Prevotella sp.]|nr:hypothetical protein [Prevotella sp.]